MTGYAYPEWNTVLYAAHDAEELAKALRAQKGGIYADVQTKIVAEPTRDSVLDGLYWLQRSTTSRDLAVVFLAGHGIVDARQKFWFLTREADLARLRATAISNDDLVEMVSSIPGKKVLFIDACYAGAAMAAGARGADVTPDMNKVLNDFSTAGRGLVVFSASTGTEHSREDVRWDRHGAFTKALIEAIGEGKAWIDSSGEITTDLLDHYLVERVKDLTGGVQHPVMSRPILPDFPIALAFPSLAPTAGRGVEVSSALTREKDARGASLQPGAPQEALLLPVAPAPASMPAPPLDSPAAKHAGETIVVEPPSPASRVLASLAPSTTGEQLAILKSVRAGSVARGRGRIGRSRTDRQG